MITMLSYERNKRYGLNIVWVILFAVISLSSACNQSLKTGASMKYLGDVDPGFLSTIVWSPDGKKIAATTYHGYNNYSKVYLFNIETHKFQQVLETSYGPITAAGWSPDGKQLLLYSDEEGKDFKPGIWMLNLDGNFATQFISEGDLAAWSFDGNTLAIFRTMREAPVWDIALYTRNLDSSDERVVYQTRGKYLYGLSWSPDGTHLAFAVAQETQLGIVNIYNLNVENGELIQLTTSGKNSSPTWSPKGDLIAYITEDGTNDTKLRIQKSDGSCTSDVLSIENMSSPSWSPDGRSIAFVGTTGGIYQLDLAKALGEQFLSNGLVCP